ncbi:hypothetical protein Bca52824_059707 [Brassica carinata]|uniref:MATH domain-containing protein n=1 Tax=Brassica carinata TaxID=52824 RepID=A0A8X7QWF3_BRACI|nr:hypothetical protein Bca52824_059707 [Brassica carinata]
MEDHKLTTFTFEIDNFSEGNCNFIPNILKYANVYPKGNGIEDHLAVYLQVANYGSLQLGWKRRAKFSFVLLNQSGKEFYKSTELCNLYCAQVSGWGIAKVLTLKKLKEKGFVEKNKLIVKVQVQVLEVVNEAEVTGNETMNVKGFQVLYSQVVQVSWIFVNHPDIALNFKPKSHLVKTTYMNLLLKLIEKLDNTRTELVDLTQTGFKLDWLKEKLDVIYLERKKTADASRIQELEQHNKNLKAELNKEKIKSAQTVSNLKTKQNKKPKLSPN